MIQEFNLTTFLSCTLVAVVLAMLVQNSTSTSTSTSTSRIDSSDKCHCIPLDDFYVRNVVYAHEHPVAAAAAAAVEEERPTTTTVEPFTDIERDGRLSNTTAPKIMLWSDQKLPLELKIGYGMAIEDWDCMGGAIFGTSSGRCIQLGQDERDDFLCHVIFKIDDPFNKSTVTLSGLVPHWWTGMFGKFAVTGGTGCYEGAYGSLLVIPLFPSDEDGFLHLALDGLLPTTDQEKCDSSVFRRGLFEWRSATDNTFIADSETLPGSIETWSEYGLSNDDGELVGFLGGECILLPTATHWFCSGQIDELNKYVDTMTFSGYIPNSYYGTGIFSITGGTGCFEGASGTLSRAPQMIERDGDRIGYKWELETTEGKCPTSLIEMLGGNSIVYDEDIGSTMFGDFMTSGSTTIWYSENSLHSGAPNGTVVGSSLGHCTLLPGLEEWMCIGQLLINAKQPNAGGISLVENTPSSIVYSGFSKNAFDKTASNSIDGGTGQCLDWGIGGELLFTTISTTEPGLFDYYVYEIYSTNEATRPTDDFNTSDKATGPTDDYDASVAGSTEGWILSSAIAVALTKLI